MDNIKCVVDKCKNIGCLHCIDGKCKDCCNESTCGRHFKKCVTISCHNQVKKGLQCQVCSSCCDSKSLNCLVHSQVDPLCVVCKATRYYSRCKFQNCLTCCENEECDIHLNVNNRCNRCKLKFKVCIGNRCQSCICDDSACETHYIKCSSCNEISISKSNQCKNCKGCCKNLRCIDHFIQDTELTKKILNDYKVALCVATTLPESVIDMIIDDYVDARFRCTDCNSKIDISNCTVECNECDDILCAKCAIVAESRIGEACSILKAANAYSRIIECYDMGFDVCKECYDDIIASDENEYDSSNSCDIEEDFDEDEYNDWIFH